MRRLFLMKGERQMSLFTIADTHLSLAGDKPMDVFSGWSNYVERLEKNWRAVVGEDDTVVMPGDISWELKLDSAAADFGFINSLPGKKLIIKGNHDLWWSTVKKMRAFTEKHGFDTIDFINNSAVRVDDICVCGTRGWLIEESGTDSKLINREALRLRASLEAGRSAAKCFSGRSIRELIRCMALHYGFTLDWSHVDRGTMLDAAIRSVVDSRARYKYIFICLNEICRKNYFMY